MPKKISDWLEGYITALSEEGYSYSRIVERCKQKGHAVSKASISNVINQKGKERKAALQGTKLGPKPHPAPKRTKVCIRKVKTMAMQENPPTQRVMAQKCQVSQRTINKIIHKDLKLQKKFKSKVHALLPKHVAERRTNCRKLYENYLAGNRWQFVVTLDEAYVYLSDCNKIRAIYYRSSEEKSFPVWYRQCKESFSRGFMIVAGFCYQGKLLIRKVPSKTKVNSLYYQESVLRHIFEEEIPTLYGSEAKNVWVHHDKASSHTSQSTIRFCQEMKRKTGINTIPFSSIPVKSPDASPMDFCAFGLLKRALGDRRPTTLDGLWKICQEEWSALDLVVLRRSLLSWKVRCRTIVKNQGHQIEHNRTWRKN